MKWFKHSSDLATRMEFISLLLALGAEGYGIFCICLEQIAKQYSGDPGKEERESCLNANLGDAIALFARCDPKKVIAVMDKCVELGIFRNKTLDGIRHYYCPMMQEITDEYTSAKQKGKRFT